MTLWEQIRRLKEETGAIIAAHTYQPPEIQDVADILGDSFVLAQKAKEAAASTVVVCGVRFMAEGIKILAPDKRVILAAPQADCPMARQIEPERVAEFRRQYPDVGVVAYINTTAELKAQADVCVTSSSAVEICRKMDAKDILFIPDQNLAQYVAKQLPEKNIRYLHGGCPRHAIVTVREVEAVRAAHPNAILLVHPECIPEVTARADYVGSTTGIMKYAMESDAKEFIIGTETSIAEHLQFDCPDKRFYPLSDNLMCSNMKITTLMDVYHCVQGSAGEEMELEDEVIAGAKRCIDEMIRLGG